MSVNLPAPQQSQHVQLGYLRQKGEALVAKGGVIQGDRLKLRALPDSFLQGLQIQRRFYPLRSVAEIGAVLVFQHIGIGGKFQHRIFSPSMFSPGRFRKCFLCIGCVFRSIVCLF